MALEFFPIPFITGCILLGLVLIILRRREQSLPYLLFCAAFGIYALMVVSLTLFPIPARIPGEWRQSAVHIFSLINLAPLQADRLFDLNPNYAIHELGGNLALTLPYGFGLPLLTRFRTRRLIWLALVPGLAIEIAQLGLSLIIGAAYRTVDINDVILNTCGAFLGYGLFLLFSKTQTFKTMCRLLP